MYMAVNLRILLGMGVEFLDQLSDRQLHVASYYCSCIRYVSGPCTSIYNALRLDFDKKTAWFVGLKHGLPSKI
jgi:hypothetical protein